jgi:hypothetical protein
MKKGVDVLAGRTKTETEEKKISTTVGGGGGRGAIVLAGKLSLRLQTAVDGWSGRFRRGRKVAHGS